VIAGDDAPTFAPYGVLDMEFSASPGETIVVAVHFEEEINADAKWLRQRDAVGWNASTANWSLAADLKSVTLEVIDGGAEDLDHTVNGRIRISGGIGWSGAAPPPPPPPPPPPAPPPAPPPPSSESGGGGSSGMIRLFVMLAILARRQRSAVFR